MKKDCHIFEILQKQLRSLGIGFRSDFMKDVLLPAWWDNSMADNESFVTQLALSLSKRLGLPIKALLSEDVPLPQMIPAAAYKLPEDKCGNDVKFPTALMANAADIALRDLEQKFSPLAAEKVRQEILQKNSCVNFYSLLDFCWQSGIPVLHVANLPHTKGIEGWKRPVAVTLKRELGYAIFLCVKHTSQAGFLFELAHEIGHVMLGHLNDAPIHCDDNASFQEHTDSIEEAANRYAETLLGTCQIPACSTPEVLAIAATRTGIAQSADAGHLILHYGFQHQRFAFAEKALAIVEQKKSNAPAEQAHYREDLLSLINRKAFAALNFDEMKLDDAKFFCALTGIYQG